MSFGLAAIAGIVCIAGFAVDSQGYTDVEPLEGCYNTDDGKTYGDEGAASIGALCALDDGNISECLCQESDSTDTCYEYDLAEGTDCGQILNEYTDYLLASVVLGAFCSVFTWIQASVSCTNFWFLGDQPGTTAASSRGSGRGSGATSSRGKMQLAAQEETELAAPEETDL